MKGLTKTKVRTWETHNSGLPKDNTNLSVKQTWKKEDRLQHYHRRTPISAPERLSQVCLCFRHHPVVPVPPTARSLSARRHSALCPRFLPCRQYHRSIPSPTNIQQTHPQTTLLLDLLHPVLQQLRKYPLLLFKLHSSAPTSPQRFWSCTDPFPDARPANHVDDC